MNAAPKNFAPLLIAVSLLIAMGIFWFGWQSYTHLQRLERLEVEVFETSHELDGYFREFHRALGFGGFIHNVKQYLVHRDPIHLFILRENVYEVEESYSKLKLHFDPGQTDRAIEKLDEFVVSIREKYQILSSLENQSLTARELDLLLAIETPETLSSLVTLESLKRRKYHESIAYIKGSIADLVRDLLIASVLLPITLVACISFAWLLNRNYLIKNRLARELLISQELASLGSFLNAPGQTIENIAARVLESAQKLTGSAQGYVSEIDPVSGDNIAYKLTAKMADSSDVAELEQRICFSREEDGRYPGPWGHALNTGEPFFTNSTKNHLRAEGLPAEHSPISKHLSTPVKFRGSVIGQIALANPSVDYTSADLEVCLRLADLFALALERRRKEVEAAEMEKQLLQSHKMEAVGTMAGGIAHNFNNSLAIILGNLEMMKLKLPEDAKVKQYLQNAHIATRRSTELVRKIMTYSRQTKQSMSSVAIFNTLNETLKLLRPTLPSTIELKKHIAPGTQSILVNADENRIQEALLNLCNNAVHAMDEKGRLTIHLDREQVPKKDIPIQYDCPAGEYLKLSIRDTGCGMPPEVVDKIFDPFFTTKAVDKGTGIGLSTVQGIMEQHNGFIKVESSPGNGTCFELFFPLGKLPDAEVVVETEELSRGNEKILLVDDDKILLETLSAMLSSAGYRVTSESDSEMALEQFKKNPEQFDLIITDQTMPRLPGKEFSKKLLKLKPNLPIILCTGYSSKISHAEAERIGLQTFLEKPVDMPRLLSEIRKIFD